MRDNKLQQEGEEICLSDIMRFFKCNWKIVVLGGGLGLAFSGAYVARIPERYEAILQIQMAQFSAGVVEEPAMLIQRLRLPSAYSVEVLRYCEMPEAGDFLGGKLDIKPIPNVTTAVDMKLQAAGPAQAKQCAEAIATMITAQQSNMLEEHLSALLGLVVHYQQALADERLQAEKIKAFSLSDFGYLARLDKSSWLRTRIAALQEEIFLSRQHPTKLMAPIYVPSKPLPSKSGVVLWLGVISGLMLGVLYALGREAWRKAG